MKRAARAFVALLALAAPARAEPPRNALSVPLVALFEHALALEYERHLAPQGSLATSMAFRKSGGRDFDVVSAGFGLEARYWLRARDAFVRGPHLGVRFELGVLQVADSRHVLGETVRFGESVAIGWRFAPWDLVAITPSVGMGLRTEIDPRGRLPPWTRPEYLRLGDWCFLAGLL